MSSVTAFTTTQLGGLDRAQVLLDSLREQHADWRLVIVLVDEPPADDLRIALQSRFDALLTGPMLLGPGFRAWIFGHGPAGCRTAIVGPALHHLLEQASGPLVYVAADSLVLAPLHPLVQPLSDGAGAVATADTPTRLNARLLAMSPGGSGRRFAAWFDADRARHDVHGSAEPALAEAAEQVPDLAVVRDPGIGFTAANSDERHLTLSETGEYVVDGGGPLRLVHIEEELDDDYGMTTRAGADNVHVAEIWRYYRDRVLQARERLPTRDEPTGLRYDNGDVIPASHRQRYREDPSLRARFPDPFAMPVDQRPGV